MHDAVPLVDLFNIGVTNKKKSKKCKLKFFQGCLKKNIMFIF